MHSEQGRTTFTPVQIGIVMMTLITAAIHLYLVQVLIANGMSGTMFMLNGLGYMGLLVALFLPLPILRHYRSLIRYLFIGYTILTIVLWLILGSREMIAYIDKLAEVILVALLWLDRSRK